MKPASVRHFGLLSLLFHLSACGASATNQSNLTAVTPPENRPEQTVQSFWLYENNSVIEQPWNRLADSNKSYFPESFPTSLQDYFWVVDSAVNVKLVPDRMMRHMEGRMTRLQFPASGGRANLSFQHEFFADMTGSTSYALTPIFEVSGKIGDQVNLRFTSNVICFRFTDDNTDILILKEDKSTVEKNVVITRDKFETETHRLEDEMGGDTYLELKKSCKEGTLATAFDVDVKVGPGTTNLQVDFPGILVKHATGN